MNPVFLSIIMPALNEEKNILSAVNNTLKAFEAFKLDGEIVIINDGSSDKTSELVKGLMSKESNRVCLVDHQTPQGIGASFWDGVLNARGEIVCMLPGDNENDPCEIFRYLKLLDEVDMVVPFVYNKRDRTLFRNMLSSFLLMILNSTFGTSFNYPHGTVLYRRSILSDIDHRSSSFFFQADILIRLAKRGYLFAEAPYRLGSRKIGKSKATTFSNSLRVIKEYLKLVYDIYFGKKEKSKRYKFVKDCASAQRYGKDLD